MILLATIVAFTSSLLSLVSAFFATNIWFPTHESPGCLGQQCFPVSTFGALEFTSDLVLHQCDREFFDSWKGWSVHDGVNEAFKAVR
ncbi:hypothetical protein M758_UG297600 [Ceratodon purpureus]|nr:hypothetical protein M758_UG091400 [Ceratodon purpureus]KAG0596939.1 hypothetical protein M758_UG297600 [Ceratodon purpureus]